jgi:hypothetical protein
MSVFELLDYKIVLVCIYSSVDANFPLFVRNLEIVIQKAQLKGKRGILFGDQNINFTEDSAKL